MKRVVLFKEEAEEYRAALKAVVDCEASFVDTLQYSLVNLEQLREALEDKKTTAVVVTSVRAVSAVEAVWRRNGKRTSVWALGGATARAVRERLGLEPQGGDAANAAQLAERVTDWLCSNDNDSIVLWPHGQRADPALSAALSSRGLSVRAITVYESLEHCELQSRLAALETCLPSAAAYFSPSGVQLVFQHAPWMQSVPSFAIGATTAAALCTRAVQPAGVAAAPNAGALADAVAQYFQSVS